MNHAEFVCKIDDLPQYEMDFTYHLKMLNLRNSLRNTFTTTVHKTHIHSVAIINLKE